MNWYKDRTVISVGCHSFQMAVLMNWLMLIYCEKRKPAMVWFVNCAGWLDEMRKRQQHGVQAISKQPNNLILV